MMDASKERRKRKWDQDNSGNVVPTVTEAIDNNQNDPNTHSSEPRGSQVQKNFDFVINDLLSREELEKPEFLRNISQSTGSNVFVFGKYYADKSLGTPEQPPLAIRITSDKQESIDAAVTYINETIARLDATPPVIPPSSRQGYNIQKKVFVGIDGEKGFNVRSKVIGLNNQNLSYIENNTNTRLQLRGRGSGFIEGTSGTESYEAMYIFISSPIDADVNKAIILAEDLILSIKADFEKFSAQPKAQYAGYASYLSSKNMPQKTHQHQYQSQSQHQYQQPSINHPLPPPTQQQPPYPPNAQAPYSQAYNQYMPPQQPQYPQQQPHHQVYGNYQYPNYYSAVQQSPYFVPPPYPDQSQSQYYQQTYQIQQQQQQQQQPASTREISNVPSAPAVASQASPPTAAAQNSPSNQATSNNETENSLKTDSKSRHAPTQASQYVSADPLSLFLGGSQSTNGLGPKASASKLNSAYPGNNTTTSPLSQNQNQAHELESDGLPQQKPFWMV